MAIYDPDDAEYETQKYLDKVQEERMKLQRVEKIKK